MLGSIYFSWGHSDVGLRSLEFKSCLCSSPGLTDCCILPVAGVGILLPKLNIYPLSFLEMYLVFPRHSKIISHNYNLALFNCEAVVKELSTDLISPC